MGIYTKLLNEKTLTNIDSYSKDIKKFIKIVETQIPKLLPIEMEKVIKEFRGKYSNDNEIFSKELGEFSPSNLPKVKFKNIKNTSSSIVYSFNLGKGSKYQNINICISNIIEKLYKENKINNISINIGSGDEGEVEFLLNKYME